MLKSIKAFFAGLLLKVKTLLAKHVPLAEILYQDFVNSEEGKKVLAEFKKASEKEVAIQSILNLLRIKALALAQDNPELTRKIMSYLKKKILASF